MENKFITRKEAASLLKVSITKFKDLEAEGKITGVKGFGRAKLYLISDVEALFDELCAQLEKNKAAIQRLRGITL